MSKNYKQLKVWQGLVVLVSAAVVIFIVSPTVLSPFGIYGSLSAEWLMLAAALGLVLAFRGNPRELFPFRRPAGAGGFGTFLMWVGAFLIEMTLVLLVSIFFMEEIVCALIVSRVMAIRPNTVTSSSKKSGKIALLERVTHAIKPPAGKSVGDRGGSPQPPRSRGSGLFGVCLVVARLAQAHQVTVRIRQLRVLVSLFEVMHDLGRDGPPIPLAPRTPVPVTPEDCRSLPLPALRRVVKSHSRSNPAGKQKNARASQHRNGAKTGSGVVRSGLGQYQPVFRFCISGNKPEGFGPRWCRQCGASAGSRR